MHDQHHPGITLNRRQILMGMAGAGLMTGDALSRSPRTAMSDEIPVYPPDMEFVYEAIIEVAPVQHLGEGPNGRRAIVSVTGGRFEGPEIRGRVLAGGADRQLLRADGCRVLDALFEMQTDDDAIITVRDQVIIAPGRDRRPCSSLQISAPRGKYEWLNQYVHVGTLDLLFPKRSAVLSRVFRLT